MKAPSTLHWVVLVGLGTLWGCSFLAIKKSVQVFDPLQMAAWRMVLAWLVYVPVALVFWSKINWRKWKPLVGVALFGSAIPNFLFAVAQQHVNSGLAGTLNSLTPIFTLLLGVLFFGMGLTRNKVLGVVLGLSGALLLVAFHGKGGFGGDAGYAFLCAMATLCYAINANLVNTYLRGEHPAAIASAAFMLTGWSFAGLLWWSGGWGAVTERPGGWLALGYVFYLAAIGTALASIVYFWLLQRTSALFATSVTYLLPVVALLLGLLDGETLSATDLLGMAVILVGVYLSR
jgi:drug/metabolite transporter (DMT)-like permease